MAAGRRDASWEAMDGIALRLQIQEIEKPSIPCVCPKGHGQSTDAARSQMGCRLLQKGLESHRDMGGKRVWSKLCFAGFLGGHNGGCQGSEPAQGRSPTPLPRPQLSSLAGHVLGKEVKQTTLCGNAHLSLYSFDDTGVGTWSGG